MNTQRVYVRTAAIVGVAGMFAAGFEAGRRQETVPEWMEAQVLDFVGNGRAVVRLLDGSMHEVPLGDIRETLPPPQSTAQVPTSGAPTWRQQRFRFIAWGMFLAFAVWTVFFLATSSS